MTILPVDSAAAAPTASDRTRLSDNYDTFLVLLTAQLQNQDPLAPMDSTQFTQQLVQFSQVEQQIRTNEQLEGLVAQYQAASAGAALSYLGKDAIVESDQARLADGGAEWSYALPEAADNVRLEVRDSRGRTLYAAEGALGAGSHLFTWNGQTAAGAAAPPGVYTLAIEAKNAAGETLETAIAVRETILGVDFTGATPLVITPSGTRGLDSIRSVLDN